MTSTDPAIVVHVPGRLRLRCWGDFALTDIGSSADAKPRGRKARALIAYLALHPGKYISRERLSGLLWGDRGEAQARASLRQTLVEVRDLELLTVERDAVTLPAEILLSDLDELAASARDRDYQQLLAVLPDADELLFANLDSIDEGFDDWLRIERTRRRDALVSLIDAAIRAAEVDGDHAAARALRLRLAELAPNKPSLGELPTTIAPVRVLVDPKRKWRLPATAGALLLTIAPLVVAGYSLRTQSSPQSAADARRAEARQLYLSVRGDIRERNGIRFSNAEALLRRAIEIDPVFAPAWVDLGSVVAMRQPTDERLAEAERFVRHGLALSPNFAEGYGALGMVLGFESAEARAAIKRAAVLNPNDAQIQFWLSNVYNNEGDFQRRLTALRRAAMIEPMWHRATGSVALAAWEMGHEQEARIYQQRLRRTNFAAAFDCGYAVDWGRGEYAAIVRDTIAARPKLDASSAADEKLGFALLTLGYVGQARLLLRLPEDLWHVASGQMPTQALFRQLNDRARHEWAASRLLPQAVGRMLNAGQAAEVVQFLADPTGPLGAILSDDVTVDDLLELGPNVALTLRAVGRTNDADDLLDRVEQAAQRSLNQGAVPNWLYASVAQMWAVRGKRELALRSLQNAVDRGWHYNPHTPLPDIADLPAFRILRGDSRFERLRASFRSELNRQRHEVAALTI